MNNDLLVNMAFNVIGGLGIFLLGMRNLSDGLQTVAGARLRKLIGMATDNKLMATGVGALSTCIIQSSSITTVMVVGFVNSGLMTLHQAIGVIMGANIGTTITGWILVINIGKYGMPVMGIAAVVYLFFAKREKLRYAAMAVMGIGMVFVGLELMKNGFAPIRDIPEFIEWFHRFDASTYGGVLMCALVGCVLTFIVQSSSATLGITMGLASQGIIGFETAAALVLGENVGTTVTAILASFGTTTNGKRAAYAHTVFNILGVLWITAIFGIYIGIIRHIVGNDPNTMLLVNGKETFPYITAAIAAAHTGFNVMNTLLFIPLSGVLAAILIKLVPEEPTPPAPKFTRLGKHLINSPMVGIAQSRREIRSMGRCDHEMFANLRTIISTPTVDEEVVKKVFELEGVLDHKQMEITEFLTDLLSGEVPRSLGENAQKQIRLADEYETISDYITTQMKLCLRLRNANVTMPDIMTEELLSLHDAVVSFFDTANKAFSTQDVSIIKNAYQMGENITDMIRDYRGKHLARLADIPVTPLLSTTFPDMLVGYRRLKEHILNIAEVMVGKGGYAGKITSQ